MSEQTDLNRWWYDILSGNIEIKGRLLFKILPKDPRCKMCSAPFAGAGSILMRLLHRERSRNNPNICNHCNIYVRKHHLGAEIEVSMLFADVRGSTSLAEGISASEFKQSMNNFFEAANDVLERVKSDLFWHGFVGLP